MLLKSPKVRSTRLQLPIGIAGQEPLSAEPGTLAFGSNNERVRVQTESFGWRNLGYEQGELWQYPNGVLVQAAFPQSWTEEYEVSSSVMLQLPSPFKLWREGSPFVELAPVIAPGSIDLYNTTFPGSIPRIDIAGWRSSHMTIQVPYDGLAYYVFRPCTLSSEAFLWTRLTGDVRSASASYTGADDLNGQLNLHLIGDDGAGHPSYANQVYLAQFYRNTGAGVAGWYYVFGGTDSGVPRGAETSAPGASSFWLAATPAGPKFSYMALQKIGTTFHALLGDDSGNTVYMGSFTVAGSLVYAGTGYRERTNPGTNYTPVHTCDFLRLITGPNATASIGFAQ